MASGDSIGAVISRDFAWSLPRELEYEACAAVGIAHAEDLAERECLERSMVTLGLGARERSCYGKDTWEPAKLLAHALPNGTFSTTDAVAQNHVRSEDFAVALTVSEHQQAIQSSEAPPWPLSLHGADRTLIGTAEAVIARW